MSDFKLIMVSAWHEQYGNGMLRMLDGHPSLFCYPFESQISTPHSSNLLTPAVPQRYSWPEFLTSMSPREAFDSIWDQELKTYLKTPHVSKFRDCGIVMTEAKRYEAFEKVIDAFMDQDGEQRWPIKRGEMVEAFFRATFDAWENLNRSGKETHYVGYSPPILLDMEKMIRDFPTIQVIHMIRSPFAGYADTIKRPFPFSLTRYCQIWNTVQLHAITYSRKYSHNFHIVHYEDLIDDVQGEMETLMTKLDLPWSDTLLYPSFNGKRMEQVYPWGTIKTPTLAANNATIAELTSEQVVAIYSECSYLLRQFGYECPIPSSVTDGSLR